MMSDFSYNGCTERHVGCHAECEKYKQERAAYEAKVEQKKKEKKADVDFWCYKQDRYNRLKKYSRQAKSAVCYGRRLGR